MNARLQELAEAFPGVPPSVVLKIDVLREGVRFNPHLLDVGRWALPQTHYRFELNHLERVRALLPEDAVDKSQAWIVTPQQFQLPDGTHVQLSFADRSPYELVPADGGSLLLRDGELVTHVDFEQRPEWMSRRSQRGTVFSNVLQSLSRQVLYGMILRHCEYFNSGDQCLFCCLPGNQPVLRASGLKHLMGLRAEEAAEAYAAALSEEDIRFMILSGGSLVSTEREASTYEEIFAALREVRDREGRETLFLCGSVALGADDCQRLKQIGVAHVTFDLEVFDRDIFRVICPGKEKFIGRAEWERRLLDAAAIFGDGGAGCNFVLGIETVPPHGFRDLDEALRSVVEGFAWCVDHGVVPMITIWHATAGAAASDFAGPPTEYLVRACRERRRIMRESGMLSRSIEIHR